MLDKDEQNLDKLTPLRRLRTFKILSKKERLKYMLCKCGMEISDDAVHCICCGSKYTAKNKPSGKRTMMKAINDGLMSHIERLAKMVAKGSRNEEETRRWVVDVLRTGFGYTDDHIETEMKALGKRVDIAIKIKGKVMLVIECKASSINLNDSATRQAANYATALGSEWAAVTNGQKWLLYHVSPRQGEEPEVIEIFDVEVLNEDGISKYDIEMLYLLTEEALIDGEGLSPYHVRQCASYDNVIETIINSENILNVICNELRDKYKEKTGVLVDEDLSDYLSERLEILFGVEFEEEE